MSYSIARAALLPLLLRKIAPVHALPCAAAISRPTFAGCRARRYRRGRLLRAQTPPERLRLSKRRSETVSPFHSTALPAAITEARTFRLCMLSPAPPPNRKTKSQTLRKHRHEGRRERRHEYMHTRGACAELPRTSASRCLGACRFKERLVRAQRAHARALSVLTYQRTPFRY